ncbi:type II toxin-antitoxin system HipA family toxin [Nitrincola schmidtii]|uniref:type II toxin-antitoxin system HipA family toxin n=1 Tax=Nitrincola schmidtii TaxID=1730894 RepID=UPI00124DED3D|nr:type II toxin-antitoxin system HipA family toxin [Nitrincola schmidtii]
MENSLDLFVNNEATGQLAKEKKQFVFNYDQDSFENHFVSLTMPKRLSSYVSHGTLHPLFEMHLPEGYLRSVIQKHFSKLTDTDDFGLLRLLAPSIHGRVSYNRSVPDDSIHDSSVTLSELLHPMDKQLFKELVGRFALKSALSGVQPKVLAQILNKASLSFEEYIVKAWGPEYPELALNEYFCMKAVKHAKIPVPEFYLSDDDALFIMKRFDLNEQPPHPGFEDMCVLQAKHRDDKYSGSYEQVAKTIKLFVSPHHKQFSLVQFFKMIVMNTRLQNGDAHLKNFGLLYDSIEDIRLSPAYDVVSTTCYIKHDIAALTLMGSKKWWGKKYLIDFGVNACQLSMKQANQAYDECIAALKDTAILVETRLNQEVHEDKIAVLSHLLGRMRSDD